MSVNDGIPQDFWEWDNFEREAYLNSIAEPINTNPITTMKFVNDTSTSTNTKKLAPYDLNKRNGVSNECKSCRGPINENYPNHYCGKCRLQLKRWGTYNRKIVSVSHLMYVGDNLHSELKRITKYEDVELELKDKAFELQSKIKDIKDTTVKYILDKDVEAFNPIKTLASKPSPDKPLVHFSVESHILSLLSAYHFTKQGGGLIELGQNLKTYFIYIVYHVQKLRNSRQRRMELYDDVFTKTGLTRKLMEIYPVFKEVLIQDKYLATVCEAGNSSPYMDI